MGTDVAYAGDSALGDYLVTTAPAWAARPSSPPPGLQAALERVAAAVSACIPP